jgi:ribonuclease M5
MQEDTKEEITQDDLMAAGLIGGAGAKERRERIGKILKIGYTNGKQLHKRLMVFEISREAFAEAVKVIRQEEENA